MKENINFPIIGKITVHDVIDEYDYPILYVGKDIFSTFLLFQVVSDLDGVKITIANRISHETFKMLKTNEISIQDVYRNPEEDLFYLIKEATNDTKVEKVKINDISSFKLLDGNSFFGTINNDFLYQESALENAIITNKPTFDIVFDAPYSDYPSMDAKKQIGITENVLKMFKNLSGFDSPLNVSILSGSIKLRFETPATLLSVDDANQVFIKFSEVLQSSDISEITEALEYDRKKIEDYDKFLKSIEKVDSKSVKLDFATPNEHKFKPIQFDTYYIKNKISLISQIKKNVQNEIIKIQGMLTAADKNTLTLKISSGEDQYTVKFRKELSDFKFVINDNYTFELGVSTIIMNENEEFIRKYKLISLNHLSEMKF